MISKIVIKYNLIEKVGKCVFVNLKINCKGEIIKDIFLDCIQLFKEWKMRFCWEEFYMVLGNFYWF